MSSVVKWDSVSNYSCGMNYLQRSLFWWGEESNYQANAWRVLWGWSCKQTSRHKQDCNDMHKQYWKSMHKGQDINSYYMTPTQQRDIDYIQRYVIRLGRRSKVFRTLLAVIVIMVVLVIVVIGELLVPRSDQHHQEETLKLALGGWSPRLPPPPLAPLMDPSSSWLEEKSPSWDLLPWCSSWRHRSSWSIHHFWCMCPLSGWRAWSMPGPSPYRESN